MNTETNRRGPIEAWLLSLPLALGCPTFLWMAAGLFGRQPITVIIAGVALLVHLVAYLVAGLPIFWTCFQNASCPIWTPRVGIPVGILLGIIGMLLMTLLLRGGEIPLADPGIYLMGGGYGFVTALAALIRRPTLQPR